jgi:uncharacterized membrane protein
MKILALRERAASIGDALRATFGLPAALAMALGLVAGLAVPELDRWLGVHVPLFVFATPEAARGMLETVATATVAVAGLSFSVTIVAFTLSSNQLSPRVLRSFRRDLIGQLTLASFLGTFIYCLAVLARLGALGGDRVPSLSISVAVVLALASFALFAGFIGHITDMLQPSSIIASILAEASAEDRHYPAEIGEEPRLPARAAAAAASMSAMAGTSVRSEGEGFLTAVHGGRIVGLAEEADGLVSQSAQIGDYVLPGGLLAEARGPSSEAAADLAGRVAAEFELRRQRTVPQDPRFPIRQFADVALKGLSPGINDPTTAQNAIEAMTARLVRVASSPAPSPVRVDRHGRPRFVARFPTLDDLVRVGFDQVRVFAASDPTFLIRLLELLADLRRVAEREGASTAEIERQRAAILETAPTKLGLADLEVG